MTDYIGDELAPKVIRVTKGADRKFTLRRTDADGNPVDWGADVYMIIDVGKANPTKVDAVVTNEFAALRLESDLCDRVKNATTWRIILSQPGAPSLETALATGVFQRQDGR